MNSYKVLGKLLRNVSKGQMINQTFTRESPIQLRRPTPILFKSNYNNIILGRLENFHHGIGSKEVYCRTFFCRNYHGFYYYNGGRYSNSSSRYIRHDKEYICANECESNNDSLILYKTKMALKRFFNWILDDSSYLMLYYVTYPGLVFVFLVPFFLLIKHMLWEPIVYGPHGKDHSIQERLKRLKAEEEESKRRQKKKMSMTNKRILQLQK